MFYTWRAQLKLKSQTYFTTENVNMKVLDLFLKLNKTQCHSSYNFFTTWLDLAWLLFMDLHFKLIEFLKLNLLKIYFFSLSSWNVWFVSNKIIYTFFPILITDSLFMYIFLKCIVLLWSHNILMLSCWISVNKNIFFLESILSIVMVKAMTYKDLLYHTYPVCDH